MATWKKVITTADDASYLNSNVEVFKSIAVTGSQTVVADSETDTVTLVGTGGTSITGDQSADSITINSPAAFSFTAGGDTGTGQVITSGNTLDIEGGTGVSTVGTGVDKVVVNIGQAVATTDNVTFVDIQAATATYSGNVAVNGNLTVSGSTITTLAETVNIEDNIMLLNSNVTSGNATDAGIQINRGYSNNNYQPVIFWDESANRFMQTTYAGEGLSPGAHAAHTDAIAPMRISGSAPTTSSTAGSTAVSKGAFWYDTGNSDLYVCTLDTNASG